MEGEGEREGGGRDTVQFPNQGSDWDIGKMFSANQSSSSTYSYCWHRDGEREGKMKPVFLLYKNMLQNTCVSEDVPLELWIGNHTHMATVSKETFS